MTPDSNFVPLGTVLTDLGPNAHLLTGDESQLAMPVSGAVVVLEAAEVPEDAATALVCPRVRNSADLAALVTQLPSGVARILVVFPQQTLSSAEIRESAHDHVIIEMAGSSSVADVIVSIARATQPPEESVSRRLSALQRSLTQALTASEPTAALLSRLKRVCNASVAVIDKKGRSTHSTGPLPLTLLFSEITKTKVDSQMIDVDGWHGVAVRISDSNQEGEHFGWLVATARRTGFPDLYSTAAVYMSAALVEASQQMAIVSRQQERAIRAAVLEEALALRLDTHNPELAGRIAAFGISFENELRVVVCRSARADATTRGRPVLEAVYEVLTKALHTNAIPHLTTTRDRSLTVFVQARMSELKRLLVSEDILSPYVHVGIGRTVHSVGDIVDSYRDAELAVRTLRRDSRGPASMTYEDFDYATRLFADVGLDRMIAWAVEFLRPLEGRQPLIEGLRTYFEHNQNINAAAETLSIHHNSLRYRLSQVEKLLDISLRAPAAISSLFLAMTALELAGLQQSSAPLSPEQVEHRERPDDVVAAEPATDYLPRRSATLGVVYGPER